MFKSSQVLLVRAKVARDVYRTNCEKMGAQVDVIEAYETRIPARCGSRLKKLFCRPSSKPHLVTFTSSSTATNFLALLGDDAHNLLNIVRLLQLDRSPAGLSETLDFHPMLKRVSSPWEGS